MRERRAFRVSGRVQGVGFRWWTRTTAAGLGLRGTVRNARDGTVEVDAEGEAEGLERLEARLHQGPPGARVDGVRYEEPGRDPLPAGFEIVR